MQEKAKKFTLFQQLGFLRRAVYTSSPRRLYISIFYY